MTDESRYCPECERLQGELEASRSLHNYALLKGREAYAQGLEQGATNVAVEIVTWLEDMAPGLPLQAAFLHALAQRIMDAEYMPEEADKAL